MGGAFFLRCYNMALCVSVFFGDYCFKGLTFKKKRKRQDIDLARVPGHFATLAVKKKGTSNN